MKAVLDQRGLAEWACTTCSEVKPAERFKLRGTKYRDSKAPRHVMCNKCLYQRYSKPLGVRKTAEVHAYKLEQGCADCGYDKHPAALEFDHMPGTVKLFNVGEKVACYKGETIWAEIAKCEVVCANCHAIRTAERRAGTLVS